MNDYKVYLDKSERKEYDKLKKLVLNFDEEDEISVANMAVLSENFFKWHLVPFIQMT